VFHAGAGALARPGIYSEKNMKFHLSNRHQKELFVRAAPLSLALPAPHPEPPDSLAWAKSVLTPDVARMARSAEVCERVASPGKRTTGLAGVLGSIIGDGDRSRITVTMVVVVVEIAPEKPRNAPVPMQWPGWVEGPGWRLPKIDVDVAPRD